MIDVLWNVILVLAMIGTCILLVCGIISTIKEVKEELFK